MQLAVASRAKYNSNKNKTDYYSFRRRLWSYFCSIVAEILLRSRRKKEAGKKISGIFDDVGIEEKKMRRSISLDLESFWLRYDQPSVFRRNKKVA